MQDTKHLQASEWSDWVGRRTIQPSRPSHARDDYKERMELERELLKLMITK